MSRKHISIKDIIDCTAEPRLFGDYNKIAKHNIDMGLWELDFCELMFIFYGASDVDCVPGHEAAELMDTQKALNSCVLDYLLEHPDFIPDLWKDIARIDFWGTILEDSYGRRIVRCLTFTGISWLWSFQQLDTTFYSMNSKAVILIG